MSIRKTLQAALSGAGASAVLGVMAAALWLGQPGGQVREVAYGWLLTRLLPDSFLSRFPALLEPLYEYHQLDGAAGLWSLLVSVALVNGLVGGFIAVVARPLLRTRSEAGTKHAHAAGAWLVALYPVAVHLVCRMLGSGPVVLWLSAGLLAGALVAGWRLAPSLPKRMSTALHWGTVAGLLLVFASLAAAAIARLAPDVVPSRERPNILLVSIDTLRADHLHCYGYDRETSPRIDALAREGALFNQAISPSSWTLPTHVTMLTSIPAHHHGVVNETALGPSAITLPEVLRDAGYQTAGFVSGNYLLPRYGFEQGFSTYNSELAAVQYPASQVSSPELERLAVDWLDTWNNSPGDAPFFVFLHMFDPHNDYIPPPPYDSLFDPGYDGPIAGYFGEVKNLDREELPERDFEHLVALYDGEIRFTDHHLGNVLDYLQSIGQLENTVVLVTSDHGEEFFDHGRLGHNLTLYDECIRVPLIIRYPPKVRPGTVVDSQVRLMDIAPTLLSLAGVDIPPGFGMRSGNELHQMHDLTRWMEGWPRRPLLLAFGDLHSRIMSVRTGPSKVIWEPGFDYGQYYDLETDPGEQHDVFNNEDMSEHVDLLMGLIESHRAPTSEGTRAVPNPATKEHLEQLRSLGYVQ